MPVEPSPRLTSNTGPNNIVNSLAFWVSLSLLVSVPLVFVTPAYRAFSLPKFLVLITGSAALVPLISLNAFGFARHVDRRSLQHLLMVTAYTALIAISTPFGVEPISSLFGSFENLMGLLTRICFYVCFLGIICGIGQSWARFVQALWAMSIAGLCTATYAFTQFVGRDVFLPSSLYTFKSMGQTIVRPIGSLGHADYLGNFLMYTTPLCLGLALGSGGRTRRFGIVATMVSAAAIAFSGTRGAWVGLIVGGFVFGAIELRTKVHQAKAGWLRRLAIPALIGCVIVLGSVLLIASSTASRSTVLRARLLVTEGFTGAGRTLLWRDSLRMVPDFALVGTGPEGFRKAFLRYKSDELARFAPDINNESSHNSYLDAMLSYGLLGAVLNAAIIASTFWLLVSARRSVMPGRKIVVTGMLSSFAAVTVHNFFIFDQISTGLYFFEFLALACAINIIASAEQTKMDDRHQAAVHNSKLAVLPIVLSSAALLIVAIYSYMQIDADKQLNKAFVAANQGNLDQVLSHVSSATERFDPVGGRAFVGARALTLCAETLQAIRESGRGVDPDKLAGQRSAAIEAAMTIASSSLNHTLTPDSSFLLLAYLASLSGDVPRLHSFAAEALKWDPLFANSRWLMAEAYLAEGNSEQASREAVLALDINPSLRQAKLVLARARGEDEPGRATVAGSIKRARRFIDEGKLRRAERVLRKTIAKTSDQCPECHRLRASIYEAQNLNENAIAEWRIFISQTTDPAAAQAAQSRIGALRQKKESEK